MNSLLERLFSLFHYTDPEKKRQLAAIAAPNTAHAPPAILRELDPLLIRTDAATYQFRSGCDAKGVTAKGRFGGNRWDSARHGEPLLVHERLNGDYFVVDGHHRLDLALRCNALGTGPGKVNALVLREKDG